MVLNELVSKVQKLWNVKLAGSNALENVRSLLEQLPDHLLEQEQRAKVLEIEINRQKSLVKQVKIKANEMLDQKDAEYTEILVEKDKQIAEF